MPDGDVLLLRHAPFSSSRKLNVAAQVRQKTMINLSRISRREVLRGKTDRHDGAGSLNHFRLNRRLSGQVKGIILEEYRVGSRFSDCLILIFTMYTYAKRGGIIEVRYRPDGKDIRRIFVSAVDCVYSFLEGDVDINVEDDKSA